MLIANVQVHLLPCSKTLALWNSWTYTILVPSFLSSRSHCVIVDSMKSDATQVLSGRNSFSCSDLYQWSPYLCSTCVCRLYADYVLLYCYMFTQGDDFISLLRDLDALEKWSIEWQMPFNPSKCEFICITNKKGPISYTYHITYSPIREVTTTKYLEVLIDSKFSWNNHIRSIH